MGWTRVCATSDLEVNELRRFDVGGIAVVVARHTDGFAAFPPACPHMEEPLETSGLCKDGVLTCTKHLWQWRLTDGESAGPPENERTLLRYESKVDGDDVMVLVEQELEYSYEDDDEDDFDW